MIWERFKEVVKRHKQNIREGVHNCIELPFKRTLKYIPGIQKGKNIIVTANSGVGKTIFTKYMYVFHPFLWCRENNLKVHIKYFALEETKNEFIASAVSFFLKHFYNIEVDSNIIFSMNDELSDHVLEKIESLDDIIKEFLEVVDIQDDISNPTGILNYVKEYAEKNGTINTKKKTIKNEEREIFDSYEPYDDNEYVIVITDHISLLQEENNMGLHKTISRFSSNYGRKVITKKYNYTFVMVQQQSAESEKKEYNMKGELNYSKLEPSLSELADNKYTQRDCHLVWGVFDPWRYEIPNYMGYDMYQFLDNFRSAHVLKNRDGLSGFTIPLYFNGCANFFKELPKIEKDTIGGMPKISWYQKFKQNKEFFLEKNLFNSKTYD